MAINSISNQKTIEEIIESTSSQASQRNTGELGKDDFLKLLVTQLRYQDPLKPVDDKEFIAQMAQFTSLEQMQNMNSNLSHSQAFSLIGKYVTANSTDSTSKEVEVVEGEVTSVKVSGGKTYVVVNGEDIEVEKVTDVSNTSKAVGSSNIASFTNLIGFNVKGVIYNSETSNIVGVQGNVKAIQKGVYEDYAVMDSVEVEISGVESETSSADSETIEAYLEQNLPTETEEGKVVTLIAYDSVNDQKVPVKGILQSYSKVDGKFIVKLNDVYVPVESISRISPKVEAQSSTPDQTLPTSN